MWGMIAYPIALTFNGTYTSEEEMMKKLELYDVPQVNSIQEMVIRSGREYSDKLALEDLNNTPIKSVSYGQLLDKVLRFGTALQNLGVQERTHIALIGENRVQWVIAYLTSAVFNYVIVPIDKNLSDSEIYNIIHESDSEAVIFSGSYSDLFTGSHPSLKAIKHFICMDPTQAEEFEYMVDLIDKTEPVKPEELPKINPEDMAEIIFTSGSLGRAKGVMLSQKNLASNLVDMVSMLYIYKEDRFLSVLPIHHTYECTCGTLCPLYMGSSVHYARNLKTVLDDLQKVKATMLLGVPLLYEKMFKNIMKTIKSDKVKSKIVPPLMKITDAAQSLGLKDLKKKVFAELHKKFGGHMRLFIAGGAAPDPLVAKGLRSLGFNFVQGYGLTETSPILALNRLDNFKDDAAGLPLPRVQLKIDNPDEDGVGEILAKGPNVMIGYYKNEVLTKEAIKDGWFYTGDLGYIDDDGFLHITGRKKNVIISKSGKNVFPEELEDKLNRSDFILESLVAGEEDPKLGEIIVAYIVPDTEAFIQYAEENEVEIDDLLINEVIQNEVNKVNKGMPNYKQIRKFVIREEEFEKTTTQKIKRYLANKK